MVCEASGLHYQPSMHKYCATRVPEANNKAGNRVKLGFFKQRQRKRVCPGIIRAESEEKAEGGWTSKLSPLSIVHTKGDIVAGKYKIIGILGQGGVATTYEAETTNAGTVALKAMFLRSIKRWKELDLFEREARVLKSLRHPGIPEYIDYFEVDSDTDRAFYIAQMVANGRSLADLVQSGWRATEEEVKRIVIEVLEILQYLGSLRPVVIHRDIKPENIILDEVTGSVKLVDFGAVQDAAAVTLVGSTVVGTYGYMAPEQFQNRATVLSDLYGLGCTILYLVSGKPPSAFPQKRLRIEFQDSLIVDPWLRRVLEKLLEPAPEDRFQSAQEVIEALTNEPNNPEDEVLRPSPSWTTLSPKLTASSLPISFHPLRLIAEAVMLGTIALMLITSLIWLMRTPVEPLFLNIIFSLPFWFAAIMCAKESLTIFAAAVYLLRLFPVEWSVGQLFKNRQNPGH